MLHVVSLMAGLFIWQKESSDALSTSSDALVASSDALV